MLSACPAPMVLETQGGYGALFEAVWRFGAKGGAVFEKDAIKASALARQRPGWSVYESDCERPIAAGCPSHLKFDVVDLDPHGSPFPVMEALFSGGVALAEEMHLVVNDGLRNKIRLGGAWDVKCLADLVPQFGNDRMFTHYLQVAKEKTRRLAAVAGYKIGAWYGYYCGHSGNMTHYWARLVRPVGATPVAPA